jgi:PAS domain S-box-containing protein
MVREGRNLRPLSWRLSLLNALLAGLIFLTDLQYPPGTNVPLLYVVPLLLTRWQPGSGATVVTAAGCAALTILDLILSPEGGSWSSGIFNRIINVLVFSTIASFIIWLKRTGQRVGDLTGIIESSDSAIVGETLDGVVTSWNPSAERIFGYSAAEMIGSRAAVLIPPGRVAQEAGIIESLKRGDRIEQYETMRRRKDGREVHVSLAVSPIRDGRGRLVGVSRIASDVTRRKELEEALDRTEHEFRILADNVAALFSYVDSSLRYRFVNMRHEELFGLPPAAIVGREVAEYLGSKNYESVKPHLEKALSGQATAFVWRLELPGSDTRWMSANYMPKSSPQGGIEGVYVLETDISSLVRADEVAREGEEMLVALLESAAQGIIAVDARGLITLVNRAAESMFGYSRQELMGQAVEMLVPERNRGVHAAHRADFFAEPRNRAMGLGLELSGRRKDGSEFPLEISLSHLGRRDGSLAVSFITDITQRKQEEQRRRNLEDQLHRAVRLEAVGRLAGGVAHDFNNLLTALSGFSELLLDYLDDGHPLREGAEETFRTCQRSRSLIRQLLAVSRRQVLQPVALDLNAKIDEIQKMLLGLIPEDIELVAELATDLLSVRVDPSQIEQVVLNLVVNARDAMPGGGRLVIKTANVDVDQVYSEQHFELTPGPYVKLAVADTGLGMDGETLSHVFEPFFTTKGEGGTGLGLATVWGIVKQSGGGITVYSEPGRGSTFKIYLPAAAEKEMKSEAPPARPWVHTGSETVLLVEDQGAVRIVAREALKRAGYAVIEARDGPEALALTAQHDGPIDLVLTDLVMPQMNGPELVTRLATLRSGFKKLFMSGHADETVARHGATGLSSDFLEKPFTRDALLEKVRQVLDRG